MIHKKVEYIDRYSVYINYFKTLIEESYEISKIVFNSDY